MTQKRVEKAPESAPLVLDLASLPSDLTASLKFSLPSDEDMLLLASLRAGSDPWKSRGETSEESLQALTKLRPFVQVAKVNGQLVGYVTIERDGPVPGAAYMRNIVVKPELRRRGLGLLVLNHGLTVARDMHRKTVALRVDPSNAAAVSFYRKAGFTTVATVVSKKSGKLRLL
ncbi:MAG: GNAT family N-acetyltransferase, partial [Myxococcales bacterium]|nr:GNAT family N-acetyltransferase [Myxococcales bacterium]